MTRSKFMLAVAAIGALSVTVSALNTQGVARAAVLQAVTATPSAPPTDSTSGPDQLWQVTTQTTVDGSAPSSEKASVCVSSDQLNNPPIQITGPRYDGQTFTVNGNIVTWEGQCDTDHGRGKITYGANNQSFSGEVMKVVDGHRTHTHVDGQVTGGCTK